MFDIVERGVHLVSASQQGNYSLDVLPYVTHENLKSILPAVLPSFEGVTVGSVASTVFSFSAIWKVVLFAIITANFKNFPLVYHLRLLNAFRFVLKCQRAQKSPTPSQLFQPIITSSRNSLSETDIYMHKSNSSYFSDNDIARTHLVCTLFSKGIEKIRGGTSALVDGKTSPFAFALGAVSCSFRKEIKPYEQYEMWTRVLTWDHKWLYVVTHFVRKDAAEPTGFSLYPSQRTPPSSRRNSVATEQLSKDGRKKPVIYASALSKCVFKKGRVTIAPEVMLEASGLLPPKFEGAASSREESPELMVEIISTTGANEVPLHAVESLDPSNKAAVKSTQFIEPYSPQSLIGESMDLVPEDSFEGPERRASADWTMHAIEAERLRGLEIAKHLAKQEALENHFNSDTDALGRHTDGTGITGVVTTLAQLGKLSNTQFL